MHTTSNIQAGGTLGLAVIRHGEAAPDTVGGIPWSTWPTADRLGDILAHALPQPGLGDEVNRWRLANQRHFHRGLRRYLAARALGVPTHYGALYLDVIRANGEHIPLGLASMRVVTTAGVTRLAGCFLNSTSTPIDVLKYHGIGTGGTAEAVGDTALVSESTTALNPDNTRATGTGSNPSVNVYRSVGTNTVDASVACTEHGIFSQAATGGGVLLDRSLFSVVNLSSGDSLQTTYDFTATSGG